jgi:hypothetical protein
MKISVLIISGLLLFVIARAQDTQLPNWIVKTIYIDPSFSGTQKGTLQEPFNSTRTAGFAWTKRNAYLFKRNTTLIDIDTIKNENIGADSIVVGAYGSGVRPILAYKVKSVVFAVSGTGCFIKDIELRVPFDVKADAMILSGAYATVDNCVVKGGNRGIGGSGVKHLKVLNCDVSGGIYDGIHALSGDTVTIFNCYVHDQIEMEDHTNTMSIDNIHFENLKMMYVDHVYSDHSNFPGKFCLIINKTDSVSVTNSTFVGYQNSSCIYTGSGGKGWNIQNCYFEGGYYGIFNNTNIKLYNCVFRGQLENAIFEGINKWIYNCVFIDQKDAIRHWVDNAKIKALKNCIFYNFNSTILSHDYLIENFSNNYFYKSSSGNFKKGSSAFIADPMFLDYENRNFRLLQSSPCIDSGVAITENTFDIDGVPRPQGSKIDIGPYEYTTTSLPAIFNVTSDGNGCVNDTAEVKLSDSETNTTYSIYRNNAKLFNEIEGNGSELNFGIQKLPGVYTIEAKNKTTKLTNKMKGSSKLLMNPLPLPYYLIGGGYYDAIIGGSKIELNSSETGINYQLLNNYLPIGQPIEGTGTVLSFGILSKSGLYTAIATNSTTGCESKMPNFVIISTTTRDTIYKGDTIVKKDSVINVSTIIGPNPSIGNFTIKFEEPNISFNHIMIMNSAGLVIHEEELDIKARLESIPISLYKRGIYVVNLTGTYVKSKSMKIVVN